jgi:hypothetical protein
VFEERKFEVEEKHKNLCLAVILNLLIFFGGFLGFSNACRGQQVFLEVSRFSEEFSRCERVEMRSAFQLFY